MSGINIILICVGIIGFLPLIMFLYKKRITDRILTKGRTTHAIVFHKHRNIKSNTETVSYYFLAADGKQYQGRLVTRPGVHRINDNIEVFYLPDDPKMNTVKGAWKSLGFLIFVIIIAVAVLFMTYRLYKMVNEGTYY